jgi:hypothetical protein
MILDMAVEALNIADNLYLPYCRLALGLHSGLPLSFYLLGFLRFPLFFPWAFPDP